MKYKLLLMLVISLVLIGSQCNQPQTVQVQDGQVVDNQPEEGATGSDTKAEPGEDTKADAGAGVDDNPNPPGGEPAKLALIQSDERLITAYQLYLSLGFNDESMSQFYIESAPEGDNIHATGENPEGYRLESDILFTGNIVFNYTNGQTIDDYLSCGYSNFHDNLLVICPENRVPDTGSEYTVSWYATAAPIPIFDENRHVSAYWGFESDNNPDNNHSALDNVPLDSWQGLDRMYVANYIPQSGWGYMIMADLGAGFVPVPSNGIMVVYDNIVALILSTDELDHSISSSRGGIDIHDGTWSVESTGSNTSWTGTPLDPPQPFDTNSLINLVIDPRDDPNAPNLSMAYEFCGTELCELKYAGYGSNDTFRYWCKCNGCGNLPDCSCRLFVNTSLGIGHHNILGDWDEVAKQDEEYKPIKHQTYDCICVKDKQE